ncbi:hypothetical protein AM571_PB00267 (plasmid) [Rhizobium etli 8C-3]|uniref:Uncharacterized protein n=1 Tax=Rhizobium etli 8C-3 TaxID=538025 RepID=A0A1L5PBP1_RHIET|nr:hypothetical protein AM571_PB00267 [Rhizobium etli 8C-3]
MRQPSPLGMLAKRHVLKEDWRRAHSMSPRALGIVSSGLAAARGRVKTDSPSTIWCFFKNDWHLLLDPSPPYCWKR